MVDERNQNAGKSSSHMSKEAINIVLQGHKERVSKVENEVAKANVSVEDLEDSAKMLRSTLEEVRGQAKHSRCR